MARLNNIISIGLILASSICLFNFSFAETPGSKKEGKKIYVPEDYKTIKEALESSEEGDKIYIAAGKYEETSGLQLKPSMEIHGKSAQETEVTLGGVGMIVADYNIIDGIMFKLERSEISSNSMDNVTFQNCIMSGTGGANSGISILKGEKVSIINCTVVNFAIGISIGYPPCDILIMNCIISNNRIFGMQVNKNEDPGEYFSSITGKPTQPKKMSRGEVKVTLEYNDVWDSAHNYYGLEAGKHDISKDPKFVDMSKNNFHLQSGSPCIDAGDPDSKYNDSDGSRNDLGALPYGVKKE